VAGNFESGVPSEDGGGAGGSDSYLS